MAERMFLGYDRPGQRCSPMCIASVEVPNLVKAGWCLVDPIVVGGVFVVDVQVREKIAELHFQELSQVY